LIQEAKQHERLATLKFVVLQDSVSLFSI